MGDLLLAGKTALVTGAGRGIGRAIAERLAELGCAVAVHGRRENGPSEYGEGSTLTGVADDIGLLHKAQTARFLADLTDPAQATRLIEDVERQLGPIDIAVLNAGGDVGAAGGKPEPNDCVDISPDDIRAVMDRNFNVTVYSCQAVARSMMTRKSGRIVTISSTAAFAGRENSAIYAAAKAAVVHYTRSLAQQMRPYNVTVNSLAPGDTRTARFLATRKVDSNRLADGTLDRIAHIDEVSRLVELFAGPMGEFVSGQVLRVDGGGQGWPA